MAVAVDDQGREGGEHGSLSWPLEVGSQLPHPAELAEESGKVEPLTLHFGFDVSAILTCFLQSLPDLSCEIDSGGFWTKSLF